MNSKNQPQSSDTPKSFSDQTGQKTEAAQQSFPNEKERRAGSDRRDSVVDRRSGLDRRDCPPELKLPNMERRRGAGIRRPEDRRAAEEGELTTEQFEFVMAIEEFKKANKKTFPTWTEVLEVIKVIGYHKHPSGTEQLTEESAEDK